MSNYNTKTYTYIIGWILGFIIIGVVTDTYNVGILVAGIVTALYFRFFVVNE